MAGKSGVAIKVVNSMLIYIYINKLANLLYKNVKLYDLKYILNILML